MFGSVGRVITRSSNGRRLARTFFAYSLSSASPFLSNSPLLYPPARSSRLLSPLTKWINPSHGPLFLSLPPWKLSQYATPLYFQSDLVLLPKVPTLDFLRRPNSPINYESPVPSVPSLLLDRSVVKESTSDGQAGGLADSFLNFPNLISVGRLVSGPFLGWMILQEMYLPAFVGLAISGASDWLDGYVARKMGINSVVGSYLDPLADKVLIGSVALAMVDNGLLHPGLVGLVLFRDVGLVGGAVYKRASSLDWKWKSWSEFFNINGTRPEKVEPLFISKVNTVFQLVLAAAALLQPEFGNPDTQSYISYLSWVVASTTIASTAAYGAQHLNKKKKNRLSGMIQRHHRQ